MSIVRLINNVTNVSVDVVLRLDEELDEAKLDMGEGNYFQSPVRCVISM